jgi:hypothetical protein
LPRQAAGSDVGSAAHEGAGPPERSPAPARRLASVTANLQAVAEWLHACRRETVVMDRTGGAWLPLVPRLEARGVEVHRVHARHAKHLPGRTPAIAAGQWRQKLPPVGLRHRAFRPPADRGVLRSSWRQREPLISAAATCRQPRPTARTARHVQRANVLRDISGGPGWALLHALLAGPRDPPQWAAFKDDRINASPPSLANRLAGTWRDEWLFKLRQARALDEGAQQTLAACDLRIDAHRHPVDSTSALPDHPRPAPTRRPTPARRHAPHVALPTHLDRISGVAVPRLDGREVRPAPTLRSEIGLDMRRWTTAPPFASWLGWCPDNQRREGPGRARGTRPVVHRAAATLRLAAHTLQPSHSAWGATCRRRRARRGAPPAITAMAHTLARLAYRRRTGGQHDGDKGMEHDAARCRQPRLPWLQHQARAVKLHLVPNQPVRSAVA